MDFKRIQVLLIIFFLMFDVYLYHMLISRSDINSQATPQVEMVVEDNLRSRGISFEPLDRETTELPLVKADTDQSLRERLPQLEGQEAILDEEGELVSTFYEPIDLNIGINQTTTQLTSDQFNALQSQWLSNEELFIDGLAYEDYRYSPTDRVIYLRKMAYEDRPIADGTAEIRLYLDENYHLVQYIQTNQGNIQALGTTTEVMSEQTALEVLNQRADTAIPDNSTISHIRQCYYRSSDLEEFDMYSPAWGIVYTTPEGVTQTIYIDASRGTNLDQEQ